VITVAETLTRPQLGAIARAAATIVTVCAWCRCYMGAKDADGRPGISDSICPACHEACFPRAA
jgi:hypothetical protein